MNALNFCRRLTRMFIFSALTVYASSTQAHLRFVDDSQQPVDLYGDVVSYSLAWIGIGVALILVGILIDKFIPQVSALWQPKRIEKYATSILGMLVGASLMISALNGHLFSINIKDTGTLHTTMLMLEGFIGLSLILGLAVRQASILLIGLWLVTTQTAGLILTLENLWILGVSMFFLLRGRSGLCYFREDIFSSSEVVISQAHALTFLRVFIGANLVLLGFSEKIMIPELGLAFLQEHPWNFMNHLGFLWFTDELFVFSAGAVEIILGLFLMAGWAVRLTAVILAIFFLTPPIFMGPEEMIGHIPHISIVIMLLLFGRGYTLNLAFIRLVDIFKNVKTSPADRLQKHRKQMGD